MSNRKTPNFAYGNFATQKDLIGIKRNKMKTKNELLEEILHKSAEYKIPATILALEYLQYRYIGLQHYPAMQRIEMEYKSNIIFKRT